MSNAIAEKVRSFYEHMPFNYYTTPEAAVVAVLRNPTVGYEDLASLLSAGTVKTALEVGCGTGWLSLAMAYHYDVTVTGIDIAQNPLKRARVVKDKLGVKGIQFLQSDLFDFCTDARFSLVVSNGVLHSTSDARAAFLHIQRFVGESGYVFLGLYHAFGRTVFLEMFRKIIASQGEAAAFERFASMWGPGADATHVRSWFRDQVLHPHETLHTLQEVIGWLSEAGFRLVSTSINRHKKWTAIEELLKMESQYEQLSYQRNVVENRYFPGFFTVLAQRTAQP